MSYENDENALKSKLQDAGGQHITSIAQDEMEERLLNESIAARRAKRPITGNCIVDGTMPDAWLNVMSHRPLGTPTERIEMPNIERNERIRRHNIYIDALNILDSDPDAEFSCHAIRDALGEGFDRVNDGEIARYSLMFSPSNRTFGAWLNDDDDPNFYGTAVREWREMALMFAATLAEAGDL